MRLANVAPRASGASSVSARSMSAGIVDGSGTTPTPSIMHAWLSTAASTGLNGF